VCFPANSIDEILIKFLTSRRFPSYQTRIQEHGSNVMVLALARRHTGALPRRSAWAPINEHIVQGREASGAALLDWLDEPGVNGIAPTTWTSPVRKLLLSTAPSSPSTFSIGSSNSSRATNDDAQLLDGRARIIDDPGLPTGIARTSLIERLREAPMPMDKAG